VTPSPALGNIFLVAGDDVSRTWKYHSRQHFQCLKFDFIEPVSSHCKTTHLLKKNFI
jgi:hypothetical protein